MEISKIMMASTILLSLGVGALGPPLLQVYVTNFPLDEQGNLRVTQMDGEPQDPSWKVISVVENYNLTWTPELSSRWVNTPVIDLGTMLVGGYNRMVLYMRISNYTQLYQGAPNSAYVTCRFTSVYDYGEVEEGGFSIDWDWQTSSQVLFRTSYHALAYTAPHVKIALQGVSHTPNGPVLPAISCLISIGISLRNE